jgi:hypothetical protein
LPVQFEDIPESAFKAWPMGLQARNDPHIKLMHLKELMVRQLGFSAGNGRRTDAIYTTPQKLSPEICLSDN